MEEQIMTKIAIIGAGSVRYSLQLIGDIAKTENLSDSFISLMDINERRLDAIDILAKKYAQELGVPLKFEKTTNMERALEGADFVINTTLPYPPGHEDGFEKYDIVTKIGEKHGYYRGIDSQEFNMVSTYSYVLASYYDLKLALDIARLMEKLCPNAWLLQTANPVFEITQFILRQTKVKIIGFCHGCFGAFEVFRALGLNPEEVDWQVAGVNHGIWLNRFLYQGKDAYPLFDRWIVEKSHEWQSNGPWDVQLSPAVIDMYRFYGMLPIGDTCRNGSWKYNYDLSTKKKWYGQFGGIDNEVERPKFHKQLREGKERLITLAQEVERNPDMKLIERHPGLFSREKMSGEQQILFINALKGGDKARLFLNVLNKGAISGIPDDVVVEIPVVVDKDGLHPEKITPDLTERIKKMYLMSRILRMEWALEAFISRDRKVLEEILVRDPRTRSFAQVQAVLDEIMALPFHEELREHFT
ncbi:MAG: alpha-glucosidase/alpha-galactosidase [Firmicutes bacterium]|nr:alpha-glucosidase/alpha-galactosidase [Bacillota bacterium]